MALTTYLPHIEDLWFKQQMLEDAATMSYNHAYGGTIPFPKEKWADWYRRWLCAEDGKRYYRYLKKEDGAFVGELSYHFDDERQIYLVDVLVYAEYRGRGYGSFALELLLQTAKEHGIATVYDEIAIDNPSIKMFLNHGFAEVQRTEESVLVKKDL